MNNFLLEIKNLSKSFSIGKNILRAVDQFSLSIREGEILGLTGESGCGKSTVAKLILGLDKPCEGTIFFKGQDMHHLSKNELKTVRREMQMVFQNPASSLNPLMTIEKILEEPLDIHKLMPDKQERKNYVDELLDLVGLSQEFCNLFPHKLSGGQKQRVSIARALALKPQFLILDEPLSSLDPSIQAQIVNLLKKLHAQLNLTILFISHDLPLIKYMTDSTAIMHKGKLIEWGSTEQVFTQVIKKSREGRFQEEESQKFLGQHFLLSAVTLHPL